MLALRGPLPCAAGSTVLELYSSRSLLQLYQEHPGTAGHKNYIPVGAIDQLSWENLIFMFLTNFGEKWSEPRYQLEPRSRFWNRDGTEISVLDAHLGSSSIGSVLEVP